MNERHQQYGGRKVFNTTTWSVVLSAQAGATAESTAALNELCRSYWPAIFFLARQSGKPHHEAQDLTQAFFSEFLENGWLENVNQSKGRFRSFLSVAFRHFMINDWHHGRALKRGGGIAFLPLSFDEPESRYQREPTDGVTPETLYNRQWAHTLLEQTFAALQLEKRNRGAKEEREYLLLKPLILPRSGGPSYAELATQLGITDGEKAVTMRIKRLRERFGILLRTEISRTVANPSEIEEEIRELFKALSG